MEASDSRRFKKRLAFKSERALIFRLDVGRVSWIYANNSPDNCLGVSALHFHETDGQHKKRSTQCRESCFRVCRPTIGSERKLRRSGRGGCHSIPTRSTRSLAASEALVIISSTELVNEDSSLFSITVDP